MGVDHAFLAADHGLALEPRDDHAAYIGNWLAVLKEDKRAILIPKTCCPPPDCSQRLMAAFLK